MGTVRFKQGRLSDAISLLQQANNKVNETTPNRLHGRIAVLLTLCLAKNGNQQEADDVWKRFIEVLKADPSRKQELEQAQRLKESLMGNLSHEIQP
ncbi:MAG: hypothetical protein R3C49_10260 [Planctomycetaceae bacterium]